MAYSPIDPKTLVRRAGEWLRTEGPDADVVVSCRVRLARNLQGEPFVIRTETVGQMHILDGISGFTIAPHLIKVFDAETGRTLPGQVLEQ